MLNKKGEAKNFAGALVKFNQVTKIFLCIHDIDTHTHLNYNLNSYEKRLNYLHTFQYTFYYLSCDKKYMTQLRWLI